MAHGAPTRASAAALLEAARLGLASAQVQLARHLEEGSGAIGSDPVSAARWYVEGAAAADDHGASLRRWGVLLATGAASDPPAPLPHRAHAAFSAAAAAGTNST